METRKDIDWTMPGQMSHEEFIAGIKEAEKGPFMTIDELRAGLDEWKRENGYIK